MNRITPLLLAAALATVFAAGAGTVVAQDTASGWNPRTGDARVDAILDDIDRYGARYRDAFVDELVRYHGAPRDYVTGLLEEQHWAPGDVYYACAIADLVGRSCRYVAEAWQRDHGWGEVAQRLGIEPGSAEFRRLQQGFAPVYAR